ncbi:hypothetical protein J4Q44_G00092650 [Coregonus suidteri]|uniref:Uncharacterized protein n=1 Tax=Coregonus suidteri TaxID=861788 RepID=A0AAN8LWP1_9TELE
MVLRNPYGTKQLSRLSAYMHATGTMRHLLGRPASDTNTHTHTLAYWELGNTGAMGLQSGRAVTDTRAVSVCVCLCEHVSVDAGVCICVVCCWVVVTIW